MEKDQLYDQLEKFVISVRLNALADVWYDQPNQKTMTKLIIEIGERLVNKKNRKHVLRAITGLPIRSQNFLTAKYHFVLIDEIVDNPHSGDVLKAIEKDVLVGFENDPIGFEPWNLYPWEKPHVEPSSLAEQYLQEAK